MADARGFLKYPRRTPAYRPVQERLFDHKDVLDERSFALPDTLEQSARCMDCGVPFCHDGCPLGNNIPGFNDAVHREDWAQAFQILSSTNNFPEFTGRICPAPCEHACVLGINAAPVAIEHIERAVSEMAFERGYVRPNPPRRRSGKKVAVIGSGPAGLAAADQLNRFGHTVTVFEKDEQPGGLLRYGIPDFKLEKWVVDRRLALMKAEGVRFHCSTIAGVDVTGVTLLTDFDAVLLCVGALQPRDLPISGRDLRGVHFAMDFLAQHNRRVQGLNVAPPNAIWAEGRHVVVIGGGDTGSDCVGTANRQGALSVSQFQYRVKPPESRPEEAPWPLIPSLFNSSSSHEEGCERAWEIQTSAFIGDENGNLKSLLIHDLSWEKDQNSGRYNFQEVPGSAREIPCDLALIAIGYKGCVPGQLYEQLGLEPDASGLIPAENYQTRTAKVFAAGDARKGQSLVVWAIAEGRNAARQMHESLIKT